MIPLYALVAVKCMELFSYICIPGGALECNLTRRYPFFKNLHNLFGEKFEFRYPVSELLDYKNFKKQ